MKFCRCLRFRLSGRVRWAVEPVALPAERRETPSVPPLILMHSAAFPAYCTRVDDGVQQYRSRVSVSDTLYARVSLLRTTGQTAAGTERSFVRSMEGAEYSRRPINKIQRKEERAKQRAFFLFGRSEREKTFLSRVFFSEREKAALSHDFLPSYETASTMRVSTSLAATRSNLNAGICRSCFATAAVKELLSRSPMWEKVISRCLYFLRLRVLISLTRRHKLWSKHSLWCSFLLIKYAILSMMRGVWSVHLSRIARKETCRNEKSDLTDSNYLFRKCKHKRAIFLERIWCTEERDFEERYTRES